jgi:hypothetical protein
VIVRARAPMFRRRGMGAGPVTLANPAACENYLPGMPMGPLPQCDITTGGAPGIPQAEVNTPFCGGYLYGTPQYTACLQSSAATAGVDAADLPAQKSAIATILSGLAPSTPPSPAAKVAQSNATNATSVTPVTSSSPSSSSSAPAQSLVAASAGTPSALSPADCFALFGDPSCWGPIGSTTAIVGAAALFALFLMFGGKR